MLSKGWTGKLAATFLVIILGVAALPSSYAGFALDDVRRPIYRGNVRTRDLKSDTEVIVKSDISVASAEDGRAVSSTPTTVTPIGESLKMVTKQLLQAPSATDMVATDVRTPPRVKSQHETQKINADVFVPLGKGEAMPIVMEDHPSSYEIVTSPSPKSSTNSPDGISTWILLSNGEQTTAANRKKPSVSPTADPKKETKNPPLPVAEKFTKKEDTTAPKPLMKPVSSTKKQNVTKDEPAKGSLVLQDSKFKNRTPVVVGRVPAPQNKTDSPKKATPASVTTVSTTPTTRKKPISVSPTNPTKYVPEIVPTTSLVVSSDPIGAVEETTTTEASNTTKRTRRPGTKKKKKNKNRRKRPTKTDSDSAESKIQETSVATNKIESKNPLSTSIYNYLAREVMPSVGVGIVGLVLTAGLAGLFLYPFGGGIARRNYEVKGTGSMHDHHNMYYYNSYAPHPEKEQSNAQPEEKVFGQVLTSMSQSAFSSPFDSTKYTTSSNKYRYDMHDFGNVNGYAGVSEYSTLPESVKNGEYDPIKDYNSHEKSKEDSYTSALTASQESSKNEYLAPEIKNSDYMPDSSKYYSMDPVSSHYKLTDGSPTVDKYSTFTEYTSYTNPAAVGTSYQQENKTDVPVSEDKSDKSQPQFSALVGSPQFTNTDFVGSVSLTGSYGTQEVHHRTGALASDHGPRSLKHSKNRKRRDVHDDFSNEIYSNDKSTKSPPASSTESSEPSTKESLATELPTEIPQTTESETTLSPISSTEKTKQDVLTEPPVSDSHNSGGILGFISRLAQLKLQLGINILKSTGEAFQRYLNTMAKRMETAIRTVEKRRMSYQTWLKHENKREKRSVYHRRIHKRFKLH